MIRIAVMCTATFVVGVIVGGTLFSDSQPRSLLTAPGCSECLSPAAFLGLAASVAVQKTPGLIPNKVIETEFTIGFEHPAPNYGKQYVFVPKRDIRAVGDLGEGDAAYIQDMFVAIASVIQTKQVKNYRIWSNGPGKQAVEYLHFHLGGD